MKNLSRSIEANQPIILFDGVCNLCSGFMKFVYKRDRDRIFKFAWIQEKPGKQIVNWLGLPTDRSDTIVLIDDGTPYTKSTAFLRITAQLRFPWPLLTAGYLVPLFIRDRIYDWVAENRYQWFGKKESCMILTGDLRNRFLSANSSGN